MYINNDQTKEERLIQDIIVKEANELRKPNKNVIIGFQKLTTDGETWKCPIAGKLLKERNKK